MTTDNEKPAASDLSVSAGSELPLTSVQFAVGDLRVSVDAKRVEILQRDKDFQTLGKVEMSAYSCETVMRVIQDFFRHNSNQPTTVRY